MVASAVIVPKFSRPNSRGLGASRLDLDLTQTTQLVQLSLSISLFLVFFQNEVIFVQLDELDQYQI